MDSSFFAYLQQLELMAFFSGYPLVYALTLFFAGNQKVKNNFKNRIASLLPFGYALVGTLYAGLQLKKLYPDYSFENIKLSTQHPWLIFWALLSILFWVPALAKQKVFSLIHSLVFFLFLLRDLFLQLSSSSSDNSVVRNDMDVYTNSLLINICAFVFVVVLSFVFTQHKKD